MVITTESAPIYISLLIISPYTSPAFCRLSTNQLVLLMLLRPSIFIIRALWSRPNAIYDEDMLIGIIFANNSGELNPSVVSPSVIKQCEIRWVGLFNIYSWIIVCEWVNASSMFVVLAGCNTFNRLINEPTVSGVTKEIGTISEIILLNEHTWTNIVDTDALSAKKCNILIIVSLR